MSWCLVGSEMCIRDSNYTGYSTNATNNSAQKRFFGIEHL
jgi:hypothetical protein